MSTKLYVWKCPNCSQVVAIPQGSRQLGNGNDPKKNLVACPNDVCIRDELLLGPASFLGVWVKEGTATPMRAKLRLRLEELIEPWGHLDRLQGEATSLVEEAKNLLKMEGMKS